MSEELEFAAGDNILPPLIVKVPTYQGPDCDKVDFAAPLIPVTIENKCGIVLLLGENTDDRAAPEVICERRKNGWMIAINVAADENMLVYVMDDDEVRFCLSGLYQNRAQEQSMPPKEVDEVPIVE